MGLIMVCIIASNFHLFKIRILNDVDTMTNALKPNSFHYWQTPIQMSNLMNIYKFHLSMWKVQTAKFQCKMVQKQPSTLIPKKMLIIPFVIIIFIALLSESNDFSHLQVNTFNPCVWKQSDNMWLHKALRTWCLIVYSDHSPEWQLQAATCQA